MLAAAALGAAIAGLAAGARRAVAVAFRLGVSLAVFITVVNGLVTDRGVTVLARLGHFPLLGQVNVTAEALVAGASIGLRAMAAMIAAAVYSACVDPDRVLRLLRPLAGRSALTATLISRLVPVAARDATRLREAARLRGPAAAPVGRGAFARRLLAGSLDRSVDVAATLELRGYGLSATGPGRERAAQPARSALLDRRGASRRYGDRRSSRRRRRFRGLSKHCRGDRRSDARRRGDDCGSPVWCRYAAASAGARLSRPGRSLVPELAVPPRSEVPLEIERLGYRYPGSDRDVLHEVSLSVGAGELIVLAGRSASGKTTLLRAACGLVPHFHGGEVSGRIAVAGHDTREAGPGDLAGAVGYVAQDPETQVVSTTVRAEIELPLELRGEPAATRARAVEEVGLALAIPHLLPRATDTLSGGELQRVALAAALVTRPQLVLLDEPTSQLDPVAGDELIWLLRRLNEEWGVSIVLAEHRLERCLAAADRVVAMAEGSIAFDGAPSEFLSWAIHHDVALATPGARLFSLAGIDPLPTGVKHARDLLESAGRVTGGAPLPPPPLCASERAASGGG